MGPSGQYEGPRPQGAEHRARVLCRCAEWDLALLTVDDDEFWAAPMEVRQAGRQIRTRQGGERSPRSRSEQKE